MLGAFFGGGKNSSCDLWDVENCRDAGLSKVQVLRRPVAKAVDGSVPCAARERLAVIEGINNVLVALIIKIKTDLGYNF